MRGNGQTEFLETPPNRFRDCDLFLAQKIEVGVTAGSRIDDGGKVLGKIVGVTGSVS
jgi:hypothetical protein